MELSLTNYQSWSSAQLKVEGLTVVVGPSNLGKSALGRAFKGLVRNDLLPDHIKLGTEGVVVSAIIAGKTVTAKRGAKAKDSTTYDVDGVEFAKLGGDVPQAVKDMAFGPVEVNGVSIDPVFAGQFDGQFLLGNSPAELNAVLNAFASTEKLDKGRKELARRTTETNATAKALAPQISALEEQSASLEATLTAAEAAHTRALAAAKEVTRLDKAVAAAGALLDASEKLRTLQHQIIALSRLQNALTDAVQLYKGTARAITVWNAKTTLETVRSQGIRIVEALGFLRPAQDLFGAQKALHEHLEARSLAGLASRKVQGIEALDAQLKPALVTYKALVRIKAVAAADPDTPRALAKQVQDLPLDEPKKLLQAGIIIQKLLGLGMTAEATTDNLMTLGQDLKSIQTETDQINAQIDKAREAGVLVTCPKCSHEFSTAHAH